MFLGRKGDCSWSLDKVERGGDDVGAGSAARATRSRVVVSLLLDSLSVRAYSGSEI